MTAAGTIPPSSILVLGAGVAGLQAIATTKRLGAEVTGYDIRLAAGEQIESLGAKFISDEVPADSETAGGYAKEQSKDNQKSQLEFLKGLYIKSRCCNFNSCYSWKKSSYLNRGINSKRNETR